MRTSVCYPPKAYPYMPYLAPFLLKGYVEATSAHTVRALDLNIDYHLYLWGPAFGKLAVERLSAAGDRKNALVGELIEQRGHTSYQALRDRSTFADLSVLRAHAWLLQAADTVETAVDAAAGASLEIPEALGQWNDLVEQTAKSVVGQWLRAQVDAGLFDDVDVLGLSAAYSVQMVPAVYLAHLVKQRRPEVKTVIGGGSVTHFLPDFLVDLSLWEHVDFLVPFEGEFTFVELLDSLERGLPVPKNVVHRAADGSIQYQKDLVTRPKVQPAPDFSELIHRYPTPEPIYPVLTSKGCYWGKCTFCTHFEGYGQGFYRIEDTLVEGTLRQLVDRGARVFYLVDEALPPRKLIQLADIFKDAKGPDGEHVECTWMAEARMEKTFVQTPSAELLRRSGCRLLIFGIESGSQEIVDKMKKGIDLLQVERFARDCTEEGIRTGWMFFVGLPGETPEQARETFRYIDRNADNVDFAIVGTFSVDRGAPIWNNPAAHGVKTIFDTEKPYPATFEYELENGVRMDRFQLENQLRGLRKEFSHLKPVFEGAIDRALVMFFPEKKAGTPKGLPPAVPHEWESALADGTARLDIDRHRIEVLRSAS